MPRYEVEVMESNGQRPVQSSRTVDAATVQEAIEAVGRMDDHMRTTGRARRA